MNDSQERFTGLYDRYYRRVLRYALQHADHGSAEDVASETFLIAWRRLASASRPHRSTDEFSTRQSFYLQDAVKGGC